ncbi:hypothetical protein OJAV_G00110790 [Oryzias javanicus]|uniref:Uncharacterized protein n=1 Tax=Oryzias javanicus TaxID=123683 RepID=A0A437CV07_ORYJA|nr:hypothetical protein OJAV_G00110790 [Oryzias javanicus]
MPDLRTRGSALSTFPGVRHSSGSAGGSEVLRLHVKDIGERTDHASAGRGQVGPKNLCFISDFLRGATSEQRVVLQLEADKPPEGGSIRWPPPIPPSNSGYTIHPRRPKTKTSQLQTKSFRKKHKEALQFDSFPIFTYGEDQRRTGCEPLNERTGASIPLQQSRTKSEPESDPGARLF